jgi:hypothetical protein
LTRIDFRRIIDALTFGSAAERGRWEMPGLTIPFVQARNYTRGRSNPIDVIVVHTMESPEKPDTAESVAAWFAGSTAPQASAH